MFSRREVILAAVPALAFALIFALGCAATETAKVDDRKVYADCVLENYQSRVNDMHYRTVRGERIPESEYKGELRRAVKFCGPPKPYPGMDNPGKFTACLLDMDDYIESKYSEPGYFDNFTVNAIAVTERYAVTIAGIPCGFDPAIR